MNITLKDINKHFGSIHANKAISATFTEGRIIGVLGENGAGKSTLMKILSGYEMFDSGEIRIDGRAVVYNHPSVAVAHGIGMLQQDPLDIGAFTVLESFIYGAQRADTGHSLWMNRRAAVRQLASLCARLGFALEPDAPVETLSIAQRQQLEILRLLALGVRTLILDEPTTGISGEQKAALFAALQRLARTEGLIVLLVSHKLEDVMALCDEVIVLRAGAVVGTGTLPLSSHDLVTMMFGEELPRAARAPAAPGGVVMALRDVSVQNRRLDMRGLSLEIRAGEVIGLAGLDGSGQELLLRACAGLARIQGGELSLRGRRVTHHPYRDLLRQGVAFAGAGRLEEGLIAGLTLDEHMALMEAATPGTHAGWAINWTAARARMANRIRHYNIRGKGEQRIERLSGGNQQRVLLSLLPDDLDVLLLEQPTRGLDLASVRLIWQELRERVARGTAVLFSSAELDEILTYSDRILVFYAGRVAAVPDARAITLDRLGSMIGGNFGALERPQPEGKGQR